jgi:site-specific recombinase XerD
MQGSFLAFPQHHVPSQSQAWIAIKAQQTFATWALSPDQRFVLRNLVEKVNDLRAQALFALGYCTGCRVSDVTHLLVEHTHVGPKIVWLLVDHKGENLGILIF